ncbi:hypothetical protein [Pseudomonas sp. UMAB-08]|uniref:hypothetical protein n=1 Tax=Pseudomonas sp. UMAB-08 TaxID=1365375 RepID=UPI001C5825A6|nr:hypothetical protein [Pseudomonas sp. UMAB-08]
MDLYVAISIDESSYAGDLSKLDLPALLAKALTEKLAGEIDIPSAGVLKVQAVTAVYNNWPPKPGSQQSQIPQGGFQTSVRS